MRTRELERRLEDALRESDGGPVDVAAARARLVPLLAGPRSARRRVSIVVAASLLAVAVAASLTLVGRVASQLAVPAHPLILSPSGLPVGVLEGSITRPNGDLSHLRFTVRPDGSGGYSPGANGEPDHSPFPVEFVAAGRGRAVMRYQSTACQDPAVLTLTFTVRARTVQLGRVTSTGCVVSTGLAADLSGSVLHVLPLAGRQPAWPDGLSL